MRRIVRQNHCGCLGLLLMLLDLRLRHRHRLSRPGQAGFTLFELLVVLGILALLATFAAPQVLRYLGKARSETAKIQINAIASAVELYALDNGGYPPQQSGLAALMQPPPGAVRWAGPYLKKAEGLYRSVGTSLPVPQSGPQRCLRNLHARTRQRCRGQR